MTENVFDIDLEDGTVTPIIDVRGEDTLYYRFEPVDGGNPTTGRVSVQTARTVSEPPITQADLTLDDDKQSVTITGAAYIRFAVTVAEAGKTGRLHTHTRKTQE